MNDDYLKKGKTLDDCALYDGCTLLHYNRSKEVINIAFKNAPHSNTDTAQQIMHALIYLYDQLQKSIEGSGAYKFHEIKQCSN